MLEAILFGVLQGLSEFLPISSSGHLSLAMHIVNWSEPPLVMELVVHLGTLIAVFAVYGRDLLGAVAGGFRLLGALFRGKARLLETLEKDESAALALWVVVATIPTGIVALTIKSFVEHAAETPWVVGVLMTSCGAMLLASRWIPQGDKKLSFTKALIIGFAQGLAALPGISRSGTTIVVALGLGLTRDEAAKFSFVASVPAIAGAAILEIDPVQMAGSSAAFQYLLAGIVAAVVGYGALKLLVGLVRKGALWWFAFYMIPLGLIVVLLIR